MTLEQALVNNLYAKIVVSRSKFSNIASGWQVGQSEAMTDNCNYLTTISADNCADNNQ